MIALLSLLLARPAPPPCPAGAMLRETLPARHLPALRPADIQFIEVLDWNGAHAVIYTDAQGRPWRLSPTQLAHVHAPGAVSAKRARPRSDGGAALVRVEGVCALRRPAGYAGGDGTTQTQEP